MHSMSCAIRDMLMNLHPHLGSEETGQGSGLREEEWTVLMICVKCLLTQH